jgi:hypothetical protein
MIQTNGRGDERDADDSAKWDSTRSFDAAKSILVRGRVVDVQDDQAADAGREERCRRRG